MNIWPAVASETANYIYEDGKNRLNRIEYPDGLVIKYDYDALGYVKKVTVLPNTPPDAPSNPTPANGAANIAQSVTLSWSGGDPDTDDTVKYDVYFSTSNPPVDKVASSLTEPSLPRSGLTKGVTYYWRIAAFDDHGATTYGPIWSFTTIPQTYSITSSVPGGNGTISPTSATVVQGDSQTFTFTPSSHYHVASVLVDGVSVGAPTSYTFNNVTANHTLQVNFAIDTFPITTSVVGGGSITPGSPEVNYGGNQTFSIIPATGRHIKDVKADGASKGAVTSYTFNNVTASHTLQAIFEINTYTITTVIDLGAGTISPASASVNHGESRTFTFTPDSGYRLSGIKVDGASQPLAGSYTFTNVSADHTLSASFNGAGRPVINSNTDQAYQTIQAAYDAASAGDIIKCRDFLFVGNLNANREGISVTIDGGYNTSGFSANPNKSAIDGVVTISNGTVTFMNFSVTD